jgi:membrane protein insertase Oxa1/YidC/SpoIIIJ
LLIPIIHSISMALSDLFFPEFRSLPSVIIIYAIIIIYFLWYNHKIKKITRAFETRISNKKFADININRKMMIIGFIFAIMIIVEGLLVYSLTKHLISTLQ